jgi:hypothetical protein
MPSTSFRFGPNVQHKFSIEFGLFGSEKYFIDGNLILSQWSFRLSGVREFTFNGYKIQIRVWMTMTAAYGEALVDGECVASDLFAEFNAKLPKFLPDNSSSTRSKNDEGMPFVSKFGIWLALVLAILVALKYFD